MAYSIHILMLMVLALAGCASDYSKEEILRITSEKEGGYMKTKVVGETSLTMKYLPPEYLALKEYDQNSTSSLDELLSQYQKTLTFFLIVDDLKDRPLFFDVDGLEGFKKRNEELFFNMKDYTYLNKSKSNAVLANVEHNYGITSELGFYFVYEKPSSDSEFLDVYFEDPFFETGISRFRFSTDLILKELSINRN